MEKLIPLLRSPIGKIVTRALLYCILPLLAWLGVDASGVDAEVAKIADGVSMIICFCLAGLVDRWHHRKDTEK